jgi:hypothetical protein
MGGGVFHITTSDEMDVHDPRIVVQQMVMER